MDLQECIKILSKRQGDSENIIDVKDNHNSCPCCNAPQYCQIAAIPPTSKRSTDLSELSDLPNKTKLQLINLAKFLQEERIKVSNSAE
jgi:hypothetical protein